MAKILLACHQFYPRYRTGTETLTLEVAHELKRQKHQVAIVTIELIQQGDPIPLGIELKRDVYDEIGVYRIVVPHVLSPIERLDRESNEYPLRDAFNEILDEYAPDIVHAFHLMRLTVEFVKCVKARNILFYMTITDFWIICPTYQLLRYDDRLCDRQRHAQCFSCILDTYQRAKGISGLKIMLAKHLPRLAGIISRQVAQCQSILAERHMRHKYIVEVSDGVAWANEFARDMFHRNGLFNNNEHIFSFPLPGSSKDLINLAIPNETGNLKVAFIGTFRRSKGPEVFLKACKNMKSEKNVEFYIWGGFGSPKYENELKQIVQGLPQVHFCGTFPQEQFSNVLKDIHVVVIPSLWYENTPLTAIAALAAKRVLIVSDLGGLSGMVKNGVSGFTFPAGDDEQLAAVLIKLAKDRSLVTKVSRNVPQIKAIQNYVEQVLTMYDRSSLAKGGI